MSAEGRNSGPINAFCSCLMNIVVNLAANEFNKLGEHVQLLETEHKKELVRLFESDVLERDLVPLIGPISTIKLVVLKAVAAFEIISVHPCANITRISRAADRIALRELAIDGCTMPKPAANRNLSHKIQAVRKASRRVKIT
jgi:hypothetical protein